MKNSATELYGKLRYNELDLSTEEHFTLQPGDKCDICLKHRVRRPEVRPPREQVRRFRFFFQGTNGSEY